MSGYKYITTEFMASFVVFLVALPLCMGIAIASGLSADKGLISGIIGGLVVGFFSGSPLQVSGPAAGLVVLVWEIANRFGLTGLAIITLSAGGLQILAAILKFGQVFRAVSPSVIYGMLSGIGVLIFSSQFHLMIDDQPQTKGYLNLLTIPQSLIKVFNVQSLDAHTFAAIIGVSTITIILLWDKFKPEKLKLLPGALVGILSASLLASYFNFSINFIVAPQDILSTIQILPVNLDSFSNIISWTGVTMIISMFLIASAETLLCATAIDKLHTGPRTNYNKELLAQGIGNILCGFLQALPITGVIVRSSANLDAGATTRLSTILHGAWILAFVTFLPTLLGYVPSASLAALLVLIGFKLINFSKFKTIYLKGKDEFAIFILTLGTIIAFDLLTGIILGFIATIIQLVYKLTHLSITVKQNVDGEYQIHLFGVATFLRIPTLSDALESIPKGSTVCLHLDQLTYLDHACLEHILSWEHQHQRTNGIVRLEKEKIDHLNSQFLKSTKRSDLTNVTPLLNISKEIVTNDLKTNINFSPAKF